MQIRKKRYAEGLADLEKSLESFRNGLALNEIAWVLATCPDDTVRDGEKAKKYAEEAFKLSKNEDLFALGTLAAAHAELGEFSRAIELQEQALKNEAYAKSESEVANKRLEKYRMMKPYRDE